MEMHRNGGKELVLDNVCEDYFETEASSGFYDSPEIVIQTTKM